MNTWTRMLAVVLVTALGVGTPVVAAQAAGDATAKTAQTKKKPAKKKKKPAKKKATKKKKPKAGAPLTVCRRGCAYPTLQKAVDAAPKGAVIRLKPGTYIEGVVLKGHDKDGITIAGTGRSRPTTILEGKGAKDADGNPVQNGVFVDGADDVVIRNLTAQELPRQRLLRPQLQRLPDGAPGRRASTAPTASTPSTASAAG